MQHQTAFGHNWASFKYRKDLAHYDVFGLEMRTSEDPAPELGSSFCILTFRIHAHTVTFGIRQCRKWEAGEQNASSTVATNSWCQYWLQGIKTLLFYRLYIRYLNLLWLGLLLFHGFQPSSFFLLLLSWQMFSKYSSMQHNLQTATPQPLHLRNTLSSDIFHLL